MEETVYDLEAIREALGFERWTFGGHSTGGMLGLKYGIHAQGSLNKMIIGGASTSYKYMEHPDRNIRLARNYWLTFFYKVLLLR